MARAAASYSLEKMRRALSEFQNNVAMERQAQKLITPPTTDLPDNENEDKRSGNSVNSDEGIFFKLLLILPKPASVLKIDGVYSR